MLLRLPQPLRGRSSQQNDEDDLTRVVGLGAVVRQPYRINQSGE